MPSNEQVDVRFFGSLHSLRKRRGLPSIASAPIPPEGITALALAQSLELPPEKIEAVLCNRKTYPLSHLIRPGDRVAFVPRGIPGPHRYTLGIYNAGAASAEPDPGKHKSAAVNKKNPFAGTGS